MIIIIDEDDWWKLKIFIHKMLYDDADDWGEWLIIKMPMLSDDNNYMMAYKTVLSHHETVFFDLFPWSASKQTLYSILEDDK